MDERSVSTVAEQISRFLEAKVDALMRRSTDEVSALLHPDFVYVNAGGKTFDKAAYVETYCRSGRIVFSAQKVSELEVRSFPGFAVATMNLRDSFSADGRIFRGNYRSLCVFSDAEGQWRWVAGQTTKADS